MKYVSCILMGGLGNQLFQICAVIAYAIKYNYKFFFNYSKQINIGITRNTYWDSLLHNLVPYTTLNNNSLHNISIFFDDFPTYKEPSFSYNEIPNYNVDFYKLYGYFQSFKYFDKYWENICSIIKINELQLSVKNEFSNIFYNYYNISMHFRLGDYKYNSNYPVLTYDYYFNALKHIHSNKINISNIQVLYFCEKEDNNNIMPIVSKLSNDFQNIKFTKINDNIIDWKQLLIMSLCNSNIIANSTFSWWGAYINNNPDIICYPSKWFSYTLDLSNNTKDLFPSSWIKI